MPATSWKKGTIQQEEGDGSESEPKNAPGCASNVEEHGRPDKSIQKDGALKGAGVSTDGKRVAGVPVGVDA